MVHRPWSDPWSSAEHEHDYEQEHGRRGQCPKPSTIFSPAVTRTGRMFSDVGSGQVAKGENTHGGL